MPARNAPPEAKPRNAEVGRWWGNAALFRTAEKVRVQTVTLLRGRGTVIPKFGAVREFPSQPASGEGKK